MICQYCRQEILGGDFIDALRYGVDNCCSGCLRDWFVEAERFILRAVRNDRLRWSKICDMAYLRIPSGAILRKALEDLEKREEVIVERGPRGGIFVRPPRWTYYRW